VCSSRLEIRDVPGSVHRAHQLRAAGPRLLARAGALRLHEPSDVSAPSSCAARSLQFDLMETRSSFAREDRAFERIGGMAFWRDKVFAAMGANAATHRLLQHPGQRVSVGRRSI